MHCGQALLVTLGRLVLIGVTVGLFGVCGHGFKGAFDDQRVYFDFPDVIRNVSAVTGACMMVNRDWWEKAGGFDFRFGQARIPQ